MEKYMWIVQIILALFFLVPGIIKVKTPKAQLVKNGNMPPDGSIVFIRVLGTAELLGAAAMIAPIWLPALSIFTPVAAVGFCIVMIGAMVVHFRKKEYGKEPVLLLAFVLSIVVLLNHL